MGLWATTTAGDFDYFADAQDALVSYLENDAPNNLSTYLATTQGVTFRVSVMDAETHDDSLSNFPLAHVWNNGFEAYWTAAGESAVRVFTRILVWTENDDPDTAGTTCKNICGAIGSAIQQSRDTSGNDWVDTYLNNDQPEVQITDLIWDELTGRAQGTVLVAWTHKE